VTGRDALDGGVAVDARERRAISTLGGIALAIALDSDRFRARLASLVTDRASRDHVAASIADDRARHLTIAAFFAAFFVAFGAPFFGAFFGVAFAEPFP